MDTCWTRSRGSWVLRNHRCFRVVSGYFRDGVVVAEEKKSRKRDSQRLTIEGASMNLDFTSDINKEYAAAMNYGGVDRFMVAILWWHFGAITLLTFTNSFLKLASYFPSPFAWRVIGLREALGAILVGWSAALIPALLRGKIRDHYVWRVLVTVALTTYSYLFVFVSGGSIEMHFHFFMIMALLVIYSDWRLGWIVLVLTTLHHVILNYLQPEWVYFYGRNDFSVVAHLIPVTGSAIFTTLLCQNNRSSVEALEDTKKRLELDILERMRAEEALRTSEERWCAVFENSAIGVALTDLNGRFLATNSAYQKMLGYTAEELRKLTFLDITHEDYREYNWDLITELFEGKRKQFQIEKQYQRKDGSLIWVSNNVSLVPGTESMPRFIMALSEDITERKRAVEALRKSEERWRTLLEINNAIITNLTQEALLHAVTESLRRVIPFDRAGFSLYVPERKTFRLLATESECSSDYFRVGLELKRGEGISTWVFDHQQPVLRRDLEKEQQYPNDRRHLADGIYSYCVVPLIIRGKSIGTLNVASRTRNQYSERDLEFLQEVASQVALAVENTQSYQEIAALKARLEKENVYLQEEIRTEHNFEEIVGNSPALLVVLRKVEQVAPTDSTVLIYGETGTGKELIARAIHNLSARKDRPLVKVNCSAISAGLVESELFGHIKGAFTGALERRIGRFELA